MVRSARTALSAAETDRLLAQHETGVLSLAAEDVPYAIPVSYGYDADERLFYLRLVATPGSEKAQFLDGDPRARLVVQESEGDSYHSVIATGRLVEIPREELTVADVEQYGDAEPPLFEMWGRDKRGLDVDLYVLDPGEITGRTVDVEAATD
jgi:nitroimidazol reductase NimA-like FMN-containing flavoprotein (pyridoxamine 5'-phosphate oxidase superfamily)